MIVTTKNIDEAIRYIASRDADRFPGHDMAMSVKASAFDALLSKGKRGLIDHLNAQIRLQDQFAQSVVEHRESQAAKTVTSLSRDKQLKLARLRKSLARAERESKAAWKLATAHTDVLGNVSDEYESLATEARRLHAIEGEARRALLAWDGAHHTSLAA